MSLSDAALLSILATTPVTRMEYEVAATSAALSRAGFSLAAIARVTCADKRTVAARVARWERKRAEHAAEVVGVRSTG